MYLSNRVREVSAILFTMSKSVLFVCLGNICRSPAAEAVARKLVFNRSAKATIASAGTIGAHTGAVPDSRMRTAGEARGYRFLSVARQIAREDLVVGKNTLVVAMDRSNLADLLRIATGPTDHIFLFGEFLDEKSTPDVPDPYYGGQQGFEAVLDMLERGCPKILDFLDRSDRSS